MPTPAMRVSGASLARISPMSRMAVLAAAWAPPGNLKRPWAVPFGPFTTPIMSSTMVSATALVIGVFQIFGWVVEMARP